MSHLNQQEQRLRDAKASQRNIVFPQTLVNETRFWRNLSARRPNTTTKIGLLILALFVFGLMAAFVRILFLSGASWLVVVATLLVWGPVFAAISWATKRNLRNIDDAHRSSRTRKH
jgi:hypothetical protein